MSERVTLPSAVSFPRGLRHQRPVKASAEGPSSLHAGRGPRRRRRGSRSAHAACRGAHSRKSPNPSRVPPTTHLEVHPTVSPTADAVAVTMPGQRPQPRAASPLEAHRAARGRVSRRRRPDPLGGPGGGAAPAAGPHDVNVRGVDRSQGGGTDRQLALSTMLRRRGPDRPLFRCAPRWLERRDALRKAHASRSAARLVASTAALS